MGQQTVPEQGTTLLRLGSVLPVQQGLVAEHTRDEVGCKPAERDEALVSPLQGPGSLPPSILQIPSSLPPFFLHSFLLLLSPPPSPPPSHLLSVPPRLMDHPPDVWP